MTQYEKGKQPFVFGFASPPMMLLHEFGHMVQHFTRPHAFSAEQSTANNSYNKVVRVDGGDELLIEDLDWPAEVDNVAWHEQPFALEQRALGAYEGVRRHYSDAGLLVDIEDWSAVRHISGPDVLKIQHGGQWYKLTRFWGVAVARRKAAFRDKDFKPLKLQGCPPVDAFPELEPLQFSAEDASQFSAGFM